jgi:hypothetical protein
MIEVVCRGSCPNITCIRKAHLRGIDFKGKLQRQPSKLRARTKASLLSAGALPGT